MGFSYQRDELNKVKNMFHDAAGKMDHVLQSQFPGVDAGPSSQLVNDSIKNLMTSVAMCATQFDRVANKIHAAQGSYDEVENNNKGRLDRDRDMISDYTSSNQWMGS